MLLQLQSQIIQVTTVRDSDYIFPILENKETFWEREHPLVALKVSNMTKASWGNVCGPYVLTLLNWTPIIQWYTARFVIKNGHQKDMWYIWDWIMCSKYVYHSRFNSKHQIERTYVITWRERKSSVCPLTAFASQLWFWDLKWHLCYSQVLTKWENSQTKSTVRYICGSAHNRPRTLQMSNISPV